MPSRLLLTTDAVGGVWRYTMDLARFCTQRGTPCVVAISARPPNAAQTAEAQAIPGLHLVRTGQPLDWTAPTPEALSHVAESLAALAALTGASTIHLHAPALIGTARWPAPVVVVGHSCLGTWWHAMRDTPPPPDFAWRIAATAAGLACAQAIIAPTHAHAEAMRTVYGPLDITVIHNGAAPPTLPNLPRQTAILTAGRLWDEAKNAAALDAAAPHLGAPIRAAGPSRAPTARLSLSPTSSVSAR